MALCPHVLGVKQILRLLKSHRVFLTYPDPALPSSTLVFIDHQPVAKQSDYHSHPLITQHSVPRILWGSRLALLGCGYSWWLFFRKGRCPGLQVSLVPPFLSLCPSS